MTTRPINDGNGHFYDDPSDIGAHIENAIHNIEAGQPYITDVTLEYFEEEAIARFAKQTGMRPLHEPDKKKNWALWVSKWANEARHAQPHSNAKSAIVRAAINVLLTACELRAEIEDNENPQKIAALAMLLVCEVLMGGYMLDSELLKRSIEDTEKKKKRVYKQTIGIESEDQKRARNACIAAAKKIWSDDPNRRTGDVATELHKRLLDNLDKLPSLDLTPKAETIKCWLRAANKNGELAIPEAAQLHGRPRKSAI